MDSFFYRLFLNIKKFILEILAKIKYTKKFISLKSKEENKLKEIQMNAMQFTLAQENKASKVMDSYIKKKNYFGLENIQDVSKNSETENELIMEMKKTILLQKKEISKLKKLISSLYDQLESKKKHSFNKEIDPDLNKEKHEKSVPIERKEINTGKTEKKPLLNDLNSPKMKNSTLLWNINQNFLKIEEIKPFDFRFIKEMTDTPHLITLNIYLKNTSQNIFKDLKFSFSSSISKDNLPHN